MAEDEHTSRAESAAAQLAMALTVLLCLPGLTFSVLGAMNQRHLLHHGGAASALYLVGGFVAPYIGALPLAPMCILVVGARSDRTLARFAVALVAVTAIGTYLAWRSFDRTML
jgi:hypothetical protein